MQSFSHARWKSSRELLDNSAYIVNNTVPHTQNSVNRVNSMLSFLIPRKIILARYTFFFKVLLSIVEGLVPVAHGVSVPQAGIEPKSPAAEVAQISEF